MIWILNRTLGYFSKFLDRCFLRPIIIILKTWSPSTYPWIMFIQAAVSCHHSHILPKSSCLCRYTTLLLSPHFYRLSPNHPHFYIPNAKTTSICHALLHQPHSEHLEEYNSTLHLLSFNDTPHIHLTITRSALSRLSRFSFFIAHVFCP